MPNSAWHSQAVIGDEFCIKLYVFLQVWSRTWCMVVQRTCSITFFILSMANAFQNWPTLSLVAQERNKSLIVQGSLTMRSSASASLGNLENYVPHTNFTGNVFCVKVDSTANLADWVGNEKDGRIGCASERQDERFRNTGLLGWLVLLCEVVLPRQGEHSLTGIFYTIQFLFTWRNSNGQMEIQCFDEASTLSPCQIRSSFFAGQQFQPLGDALKNDARFVLQQLSTL